MTSHPSERRRFGRRQICKKAFLLLNGGAPVAALVVDISLGGARIQTELAGSLQDVFNLVIPDDDVIYDCQIVHRQQTSVGVEFTRLPRKWSWLKAKLEKQRVY